MGFYVCFLHLLRLFLNFFWLASGAWKAKRKLQHMKKKRLKSVAECALYRRCLAVQNTHMNPKFSDLKNARQDIDSQ